MFAFLLVILCSVILLGCVAELQHTLSLLVVADQVGILLHNPILNNACEERVVASKVFGRIGLAELFVAHLANELGGVLHTCNSINFRLAPMGCATKLIWFGIQLVKLIESRYKFQKVGPVPHTLIIQNCMVRAPAARSGQLADGSGQ